MTLKSAWDDPLPEHLKCEWETWKSSLEMLELLHIPRTYHKIKRSDVVDTTVHVYCDASEQAVAAVAFMRTVGIEGTEVGFLMGKSHIAPKQGHTIPRLELCSAVLATELAKIIITELDFPPNDITYHSDSKIVLGYLNNKTRRFHTYVANRVDKVLSVSKPHQWHYVSSDQNPADDGTRIVGPTKMRTCTWLTGPRHWNLEKEKGQTSFPLIDLQNDKEIKREMVTVAKIITKRQLLTEERVKRFSTWLSLVRAIACWRHQVSSFKAGKQRLPCSGLHVCTQYKSIECYKHAKIFIIKELQRQVYEEEINCLMEGKPIKNNSSVIALSPVLTDEGLFGVGGRLHKSDLPLVIKHPILIQGKLHVAKLLVHHYHTQIHHQGRRLTEEAIRQAGFWITGCKKTGVLSNSPLCVMQET